MAKICAYCGKEYDSNRSKYCSEECSKSAKRQTFLEYQRQKNANKPKQTRICVVCGKEFKSNYGAKCCSDECREKNTQQWVHDYYEAKRKIKQRKCVVCGKEFESRANMKVCGEECRTIRDEKRAKEFYEKYKAIAKQKKKERTARLKEEPLVEFEHRKLDGKVLHKAEMTVDEYNRTHGTNYSYGQYVHYVESKGVKR